MRIDDSNRKSNDHDHYNLPDIDSFVSLKDIDINQQKLSQKYSHLDVGELQATLKNHRPQFTEPTKKSFSKFSEENYNNN